MRYEPRMAHPLSFEIRTSGIWQMTSTVLCHRGQVVLIDPGYFPRELAELAQCAQARGQLAGLVFTHGHWDHVNGWRQLPAAPVWVSEPLAQAIAQDRESARTNLREAAAFDRRWYIDRDGPPAWPPADRLRSLREGDVLPLGETQLDVLQLPGHSDDGLGLWAREEGLLWVGDYLSPCEIPFVADLAAYRATLQRLLSLLDTLRCVLPGHGPPLSADEAREIAQADLSYLDALCEVAAAKTPASEAARAIALPRGRDNPDMHEHHRDNCRIAGLSL